MNCTSTLALKKEKYISIEKYLINTLYKVFYKDNPNYKYL